jgi:hypothetical protein
MAVVPKSIMTFGASLLTARAAMRLKRAKSVEAAQDRIFMHLTQKLALGSVWKQAGIEPRMRSSRGGCRSRNTRTSCRTSSR